MRLRYMDGEAQVRYVATHIWIKLLLFAVPAAFFLGAEFGKQDTRSGYDQLIGKLPPMCRTHFDQMVGREPR